MPKKKKPDELNINNRPDEIQPKKPDEIVPVNPEEVKEQANPDEVPPLPDDDGVFDRKPEKRLEGDSETGNDQ